MCFVVLERKEGSEYTAAIIGDSLEEEGFEELVQLRKQKQKCSTDEGEVLGFYLMCIYPKFLISIFGRIRQACFVFLLVKLMSVKWL